MKIFAIGAALAMALAGPAISQNTFATFDAASEAVLNDPHDLEIGPDGRLYLLERAFTGFAFRSRVRALTLGPKRAVTSETLLTTPSWRHDNLEGLSVWKDAQNRIRLTMISDDNFRAIQRTQFVEYVVTAPLASSRRRP